MTRATIGHKNLPRASHLALAAVALGHLAMPGIGCATSRAPAVAGMATATDVSSGRPIYSRYCRPCHGRFKVRSRLPETPPTEEFLLSIVSDGIPETAMFGYEKLLTGAELRAVVHYLMSILEARRRADGKTR
ncbi:MAG: c-type cytochrome [Acidobacteriota bacterium]